MSKAKNTVQPTRDNMATLLAAAAAVLAVIANVLAIWVISDTRGPEFKNNVGIDMTTASLGWIHEEYLLEGKDTLTIESEAIMLLVNNSRSTIKLSGFEFSWEINGNTVALDPKFYFLNKDYGTQNDITSDTVYTLNPGNVRNINFRLYWEPGKDSSGYQQTIYTELNIIISDNNLAGKKNGTEEEQGAAVDKLFGALDDYLGGIESLTLHVKYNINTGAEETSHSFDINPKWNTNDSFKADVLKTLRGEGEEE